MSLRDLKEEIYLVLQIKGGHGFGFATSPLIITANLAGNIHESFVTEPCPQPKFENEFVWVMDKTKMKSIWSDKVPIKVECLSVNNFHRNRIGYIIINVKDAQIIQDESKISEKQIRLLGLSKDVSLLKPELILSFYITDVPIQSPPLIPHFLPPIEGGRAQMSSNPLKVTLGSGRDHFKLTIRAVAFANLKQMLPSQSDVEPQLLTYNYSLFGVEIISDVATNHGVCLEMTTSLACLKTYFVRQPMVAVSLHMGSLLVGQTSINMESLLLSEEFNAKRERQQTRSVSCRCIVSPTHNLAETPADVRPCVDFNVCFSSDVPVSKKKSETPTVPPLGTVGAGGDADNGQSILPLQTPRTVSLSLTPRLGPVRAVDSGSETYRTEKPVSTHTVSVSVMSLQMDEPLSCECWLRLCCASATVSLPQQVTLPSTWSPLQWQLTVTLPRRLLESTLASQPPMLQLGSGTQLIATALLTPPEKLSKDSEHSAVLEEVGRGSRVGEVAVVWALVDNFVTTTPPKSQSASTLTDTSISPPSQPKSATEVLSPRARELKILSFVEELEDWAEKQRIMVMEGLKEEEAARLAMLQSRWEAEVGGQVTEGKQLVGALQNMRDQLRQQQAELMENQQKLKVYKEELERVHRSKMQEFKDLSRRMQDEFNHKLALIASDKVGLEEEVEKLRIENSEMRKRLRKMETLAETDKRAIDGLNHELKVLKDKLVLEQESKKFFKEHCQKAEQEIHRLNCLRQQEMEARLHNEKKSLEQLAFQQIIVERNDMRQDQRLLREIRQQLLNRTDHLDVNSNSNVETVDSEEHPYLEERHIRRAT